MMDKAVRSEPVLGRKDPPSTVSLGHHSATRNITVDDQQEGQQVNPVLPTVLMEPTTQGAGEVEAQLREMISGEAPQGGGHEDVRSDSGSTKMKGSVSFGDDTIHRISP